MNKVSVVKRKDSHLLAKAKKQNSNLHAEVVCFGMIVPALVFIIDKFPSHNTGTYIKHVSEFISDDAAIVACLLRGWRVKSGLVGTALGNDARGRATIRQLKRLGVLGKIRLSRSYATPYEVNISDPTGQRTYFWQRDGNVLATLASANLSLLNGAKMLYVDWYDGEHIMRPMQEAGRLGIPVFLNLEHGHQIPNTLDYVRHATIVQANTDAEQRGGDAMALARMLLGAGAQTVLMTLAGEGCLAATQEKTIRVKAPQVAVIDGCGAGAAFSAGFIYARLRGWDLAKSVRVAVAAGSYKCTRVGLDALPLSAVTKLERNL